MKINIKKSGDPTIDLSNELRDNCRPSELFMVPVSDKIHTSKKRQFVFKSNNISQKQGVIKRWIVFSEGKRSVLVRFLFLKMIYDELTTKEMELLLSLNESTSNIQIFFALKARKLNIRKKTIRKILEALELKGYPPVSREEYLGRKQINFTIQERTYPPIEKPKPYTGYARGFKNNKRSKFEVEEFSSSPLEPSSFFEDEIIILIRFAQEIERNPRRSYIYNHLRKETKK
jgi:hypothetical protein